MAIIFIDGLSYRGFPCHPSHIPYWQRRPHQTTSDSQREITYMGNELRWEMMGTITELLCYNKIFNFWIQRQKLKAFNVLPEPLKNDQQCLMMIMICLKMAKKYAFKYRPKSAFLWRRSYFYQIWTFPEWFLRASMLRPCPGINPWAG